MRYRRYLRLRPSDARALDAELREEMDAHIEMRAADLVARGMPEAQAQAMARERFGSRSDVLRSARTRERSLRRRDWFGEVGRDIVLAWRQAVRQPGPTLLTVALFAIGIGLTTVMYTFVDRVLLRPLPFPAAERLVVLQGMDSAGGPVRRVSFNDWADWQEQGRSLAATAVHMSREFSVAGDERARWVSGQLVTDAFFDVLQPEMVHGRGFTAGDLDGGAVVASEAYVQRELGGRLTVGTDIVVDGRRLPVVGVVRRGREYPAGTELWQLTRGEPRGGGAQRNNINWIALARLADGVDVATVESELTLIARRIHATEPEADYSYGVIPLGLRDHVVGDARGYLELLLGAVLCVLLIACANLAALNLARGTRRNAEVSVRYALGGTRARVVRQLVTEQLAVALAGGMAGLLLAWWGTGMLGAALAGRVPRAAEAQVDLRIAAVALLLALVAGVVTGAVPAWRMSAARPRALLVERNAVRGGRGMPGRALVIAEVALAVVLLAGAGLLLRSFQAVLARDVGFSTSERATAEILLTDERYASSEVERAAFWDALVESLRRDPGVLHAAVANWIPTGMGGTGYLNVEGHTGANDGAAYRVVGEDYFDAMGIELVHGRDFESRDAATAPRVAIVSRSMAERYWAGASPIGRRIQVPGMEGYDDVPWLTIIGVAGDVRHDGHESDVSDHVYVSWRQRPEWTRAMNVVVAARVDLDLALGGLVGERRLVVTLLSFFGAIALALAATGLYGVLSFSIAQRSHEIGVRAALGASSRKIERMVVLNAARVVATGAAIGLVATFWLTRVMDGMLVGVHHADPLTYVAAALVLGTVAFSAAIIPARRASRVDPLTALRAE
ncbi:MAG TPA: ABC transporter permease [Longimicrobiales bacterium]|nr:ABC transporter permease [Longimicrobiales bacterium]